MTEIEGRVAVVTGAASGIGRGIAQALGAAGARLVVADIDGAAAERVAAELSTAGHDATAVRVDVAEPDGSESLSKAAVEAYSAVHILVNNAGIMAPAPLAEASAADWEWTLDVNLRGVVRGVRAFLPLLREHAEAHIVNTGSMAGLAPRLDSGLGAYSASKAAVVVYSEMLRAELASEGIGVSVLCPGPVQTRIWEAGRNRQARFGANPAVEAPPRAADGIDAEAVGSLVVNAIRHDLAYIFTNEGSRERIEERARRIEASLRAFDDAGVRRTAEGGA